MVERYYKTNSYSDCVADGKLKDRESARTIDDGPRMMTNHDHARGSASASAEPKTLDAKNHARIAQNHAANLEKRLECKHGKKNDNCEIRTHAPEDCGFGTGNAP